MMPRWFGVYFAEKGYSLADEDLKKLCNYESDIVLVFDLYYHIIDISTRFPLAECIVALSMEGVDLFIQIAQEAGRNDIVVLLLERARELQTTEKDRFQL